MFAAQVGHSISYERIAAPLDGFAASVAAFIQAGGRGANVTVPFKFEAHALASRLTARAAAAGAVNTLSFDTNEIVGDNTDGIGLVTDLIRNAGIALAGKRVLLLGAGGAAQGVILPMLDARPQELVIANRTPARADALVARFADAASSTQLHAASFATLESGFDIVINATAASLADTVPDIPDHVFGPATIAYDMMYGSAPTAFMRHAEARGASVRDGLGMLVEQAAEAFTVWRGVRPDTAGVLAAMRGTL